MESLVGISEWYPNRIIHRNLTRVARQILYIPGVTIF